MCRTYNPIGSLTALKSHLYNNNIHDFSSLKEVIDFQNTYTILRQELISHHIKLLEQEKNMLDSALQHLRTEIKMKRELSEQIVTNEINIRKQQLRILTKQTPNNVFQKLITNFRLWYCKRKINQLERFSEINIKKSYSKLSIVYDLKQKRYKFISSYFDEALHQSTRYPLSELQRKKMIIEDLNCFILGAIGEQKVVKTLENLSDEYILINDFAISFKPAIYNKQENDYIQSIQIDHILVAPSGIFLIETKNWSQHSMENRCLHSPVSQIKRASFAFFRLINNEMSHFHLQLDSHQWGDKKIPIRNLIVLMNTKPKEEFQYVKILTLNELLGYISYFKPTFTVNETQRIADFILHMNEQRNLKLI